MNMNDIKFLVLFAVTVTCEYASNVIDVDDILAEDFMPGTLLVLENPTSGINTFNRSIQNVQAMEKIPDGSFGNAMETMNFHRSMMNQYLCRNFVAEQIIKDMTISRIKRRMGHVSPGLDAGSSKPSKFTPAMQNMLLNDEGSSSYKDWLSKSTTLEDIYRHYDQSHNRIDADIIEEEDKDAEDFDEEYNGHVSGYAYPHHHEDNVPSKHRQHTGSGTYYAGGGYSYPNAHYNHGGGSDYHHGGASDYHHGGGSDYHHGGYQTGGGYQYNAGSGGHHGGGYSHGGGYAHDGGYGDGGGGSYSDHHSSGGGHAIYGGGHHGGVETVYQSSPPKYQVQEGSYGGKDHDLSDFFDIALTALAFLSFGLFIVHVIMCISAATNNSTTTAASMMMPMSMSPTATGTGGGTGTGNGGGDGSMTSTGGDGTGGGATSTGTGAGSTGTGAGSTGTGAGSTGTGAGSTGTGAGSTGTGAGSTGTGAGSTGTGAGGGMTATDTGGGATGTGGGDTGTGGGGTSTGGGATGTGGGATGGTEGGDTGAGGDTGTGGGDIDTGGNTGIGGGSTGTGTGGGATGTGTATANDATATGTGADADTGSGKDTFKFRLRRDIPTITNPNNQALNELARRVLTSIEAAMVANSDGGVCLRKSLCENNKYSRTLDGKDKIIIPVWSLGMSWLSGRLVKNVSPATSMLDTLKASILGLGRANCEIIYQECDLRKERRKRRRRRRKKRSI